MAKTKQQKRLKRINKRRTKNEYILSIIKEKTLYVNMKMSLERAFPDKKERLVYIRSLIEEFDKDLEGVTT